MKDQTNSGRVRSTTPLNKPGETPQGKVPPVTKDLRRSLSLNTALYLKAYHIIHELQTNSAAVVNLQ